METVKSLAGSGFCGLSLPKNQCSCAEEPPWFSKPSLFFAEWRCKEQKQGNSTAACANCGQLGGFSGQPSGRRLWRTGRLILCPKIKLICSIGSLLRFPDLWPCKADTFRWSQWMLQSILLTFGGRSTVTMRCGTTWRMVRMASRPICAARLKKSRRRQAQSFSQLRRRRAARLKATPASCEWTLRMA